MGYINHKALLRYEEYLIIDQQCFIKLQSFINCSCALGVKSLLKFHVEGFSRMKSGT